MPNEQSIVDFETIWRKAISSDKFTLACFQEGFDGIVGMNVLYIEEKNAISCWNQFKSEHIKDIERSANYLLEQFYVFEHYNVDRYLSAFGLCIQPWYRGRGIALKLLEARKYIGRAHGLSVTSYFYTSTISQKLAEKAGFEKNFEISFDELAKKGPHYTFKVNSATFAIYSMRL